jgi:hypothetical protein
MSREANESTIPFDERRDWMGRDIENVEIYGSDIDRETLRDRSADRQMAMVIGSAALAAAAIASIVLIRRSRQRGGEASEDPDAPVSSVPSWTRRLADRQMHRVSDTFDDIIEALVGTACGKLISMIGDAIPSFRSEYNRTSMTR